MSFEPASQPAIIFLILNLALLLAGHRLMEHKKLLAAWLLLGASLLAVHLLFLAAGPVVRMFALIITAFIAMKAIAAAARPADKGLLLPNGWLLRWSGPA